MICWDLLFCNSTKLSTIFLLIFAHVLLYFYYISTIFLLYFYLEIMNGYMVTWLLHCYIVTYMVVKWCYMMATWWLHDGYMMATWGWWSMMVTWWLRDGYMVLHGVTWWLHGGYMVVTWWLHDGSMVWLHGVVTGYVKVMLHGTRWLLCVWMLVGWCWAEVGGGRNEWRKEWRKESRREISAQEDSALP